jgi:MoaA/NifB/PqqE/SkfB family radical SAM enzyme
VRITGGEPFMRPDMGEVINRIETAARPRMIHITTNGTLEKNIIEAMKVASQARKIHIKLSIDAIGGRHDELRGVAGTFEKVWSTLEALIALREQSGFHLGVNCTIADPDDLEGYYTLKERLRKKNVPVYGVIASAAENALYSKKEMVDPDKSLSLQKVFSPAVLEAFFERHRADTRSNPNIFEKVADRYHMRGLRNRLLKNIHSPHPPCVALSSHMRILPNGDIPVCLYDGTVIGNLYRQSLRDLWFSNKVIEQKRLSVRNCKGCWQSCESIVSAIYSGDIWRGIF